MAQSEQIGITFQYMSNATGKIFASSQTLQQFVSSYTHDDGGSDLILLIMETNNNTQNYYLRSFQNALDNQNSLYCMASRLNAQAFLTKGSMPITTTTNKIAQKNS